MAKVQQFCLRWKNHPTQILGMFNHLQDTEAFVDVTLTAEGKMLKAHRVVLSACSPYFHNMFMSNPTQHPVVFMRDVKFCEIKAILDFIYKGEVYISPDTIQGVLKTAGALQIKALAEMYKNESIPVNVLHLEEQAAAGAMEGEGESTVQADASASIQPDPPDMPPMKKRRQVMEIPGQEPVGVEMEESSEDAGDDVVSADNLDPSDTGDPDMEHSASRSEVLEEDGQNAIEAIRVAAQQAMTDLAQTMTYEVAPSFTGSEAETIMIFEAPPSITVSSVPVPISLPQQTVAKQGRQYTKETLQEALNAIRQGRMGIKPAARAFNIPVATLHHATRRLNISSPMQQGGNRGLHWRHQKGSAAKSPVIVEATLTVDQGGDSILPAQVSTHLETEDQGQ